MTREEKLIAFLDATPDLSARDLAGRINVAHNWATNIRTGLSGKGGHGMTDEMLLKVARATGLSADWLADDTQGLPFVFAADRGIKLTDDEELVLRLARRMGLGWALARLTGSDAATTPMVGTPAQPPMHEPAGQAVPVDPRASARPDGQRPARDGGRGQKAS